MRFLETNRSRAPAHVLKYLARYLTGGPLSDSRLLSHEDGQVTFLARSKNKKAGNQPRPLTLAGIEFTRRWSMHILPKGFTKVRCCGGFSTRHRQDYLQRCRQLLKIDEAKDDSWTPPEEIEDTPPARTCPHCECEMFCLQSRERPRWRDLFAEHATCPWWYPARGYRRPAKTTTLDRLTDPP